MVSASDISSHTSQTSKKRLQLYLSFPDETEWLLFKDYDAEFFEVNQPLFDVGEGSQFSEVMHISENEGTLSKWTRLQDLLDKLKELGFQLDDLMVSFYSAQHKKYVKCLMVSHDDLINKKDIEKIEGKHSLRIRFERLLPVSSSESESSDEESEAEAIEDKEKDGDKKEDDNEEEKDEDENEEHPFSEEEKQELKAE